MLNNFQGATSSTLDGNVGGRALGLGSALPQGQGLEVPMGDSNLKTLARPSTMVAANNTTTTTTNNNNINNNNNNNNNISNISNNNNDVNNNNVDEIWTGGSPLDMTKLVWPWFTPSRYIHMKKYPDLFFPQVR